MDGTATSSGEARCCPRRKSPLWGSMCDPMGQCVLPREHRGECLHMRDIDLERAEQRITSPAAALHALHVVRHFHTDQSSRAFRDLSWNLLSVYAEFSEEERVGAAARCHSECGLRQPELYELCIPCAEPAPLQKLMDDLREGDYHNNVVSTPCGRPDDDNHREDDNSVMAPVVDGPRSAAKISYRLLACMQSTIHAADIGKSGTRIDEVVIVLLIHAEQRATVASVVDADLKNRFVGKVPWNLSTIRMLENVTLQSLFEEDDDSTVEAWRRTGSRLTRMYARNLLGCGNVDVRIVHDTRGGLEAAVRRFLALAE